MENTEIELCIGTKLVNALAMTRAEYIEFRGWELPADENCNEEGFLIDYFNGGEANTDGFDGHVSWTPADAFDREYRKVDGMSFGMAIEAMKKGKRVGRSGWDGKGMFLFLVTDYTFTDGKNDNYLHDPWIAMKTTGDSMVPWLASQTDMLAEDWVDIG